MAIANVECEHAGSKYTGRFTIQPTKLKCIVDMPNPRIGGGARRIMQSIHVTQVQLIRNLATTSHKRQGHQTKERIKLDIRCSVTSALDEYKLADH
eukprot:scaffold12016_cov65-Attheya_sp.AAC.8